MKVLRVASFLALLFLIFSHASLGFIFLQGPTDNKGSRSIKKGLRAWDNPQVFHVNPNLDAFGGSVTQGFSASEWLRAVEDAINEWNTANCRTDLKVKMVTTSAVPATLDDKYVIVFDNRTFGSNFCAGATTAGCATYVVNESYNKLRDCDIYINGGMSGTFVYGKQSGKYDVASVILHEIGHCMGLDHSVEQGSYQSNNSFLNNAVMYPSLAANTLKRTLAQDEKDAMQCQWPRSTDPARDPCASYHGSNGGVALSGMVSGGPTSEYEPNCGSAAVTIETSDSSGCITEALASTGDSKNHLQLPYWILFLSVGWILFRKKALR